jgi:Ca2+-binding EF-hand superfamily protein
MKQISRRWSELFDHYDTDGSGELDFDEFRKAVRRHGRMSVRSITDPELKEVFAIVDTDCSGCISGVEFDSFLRDPLSGNELKPTLTKNYTKVRTRPPSRP